MLKQKYFLTGIFILSAERQPIKLAWRKIVWLHILFDYNCIYGFYHNLIAAIFMDGIVLFALAAINNWGLSLPLGRFFLWGGITCVIVSFITTWFAYTNGRRYAKRLYNVFLNLDDDKNNY